MSAPFKLDTLNTSYVNLAAFIRYLREQHFQGRLHIELEQYEGDIFLYGPDNPSAWEIDRATGREEQGEAAMQRLLVRAREPGGVIRVFEKDESQTEVESHSSFTDPVSNAPDTPSLIAAAGELIAAVERAAKSVGIDFNEAFHSARVELGDDYTFMDPTSGSLEYEGGVVTLDSVPQPTFVIAGVSGVLKRTVDLLAQKTDADRLRELVAAEFATLVRRLDTLGDFASQLDRIAGSRVR
jgi:hypothetical protein